MKIIYFLFVFLLLEATAFAAKTNMIFITDDGHLYFESVERGRFIDPAKIEAAKKSRESLPAKDFPEGNWGTPFLGLQLSLRLNKPVYTNGEPIPALVLVRDVTNLLVDYPGYSLGYGDDPIRLIVTTISGQAMPRPDREPVVFGAGAGASVEPFTKKKYTEHIGGYNLTNGTYLVHAETLAIFDHNPPTPPFTKADFLAHQKNAKIETHKVESADVPFEIK